MDESLKNILITAQRNEITEYNIYKKLSSVEKNRKNKEVLESIAKDELNHYNFWKKFTKMDIKPNSLKVNFYSLVSKLLGITFAIKHMENGEKGAQLNYAEIARTIKEAKHVEKDENRHEKYLINMIDEERLQYVGSMVLGINDALVELTGALAGLTFALAYTGLIAFAGLMTGVAAALSMAASEYLSTRAEETKKNPVKASVYTGIIYLATVLLLITPYFIFESVYISLAGTVLIALIIIAFFTFYVSVAKDVSFKKRFLEMALISLGVAAFTFALGFVIKVFFKITL